MVDTVERKPRNEVPIGAEQLNAMVSRVRHQNLRLCVDGASPRIHELTQLLAVAAELVDEHAGVGEHLDAMIVFVNHNDPIVLVGSDSGWKVKLPVAGSFHAKLELECTVGEKDLNPIIATVGDDDFVVFVDANACEAQNTSNETSIQKKLFCNSPQGRETSPSSCPSKQNVKPK